MEHSAPIVDAHLADPFVVRHGAEYLLYGSHEAPDGRHLPIYRSLDLQTWTFVRGAVERGVDGA